MNLRVGAMSEEKICRCSHNYAAHGHERIDPQKKQVCDCFHCKECGKDQNGNFKCEGFCGVGSLTPEYRARIKAENEAYNKAQDDARKKAEDEARKKAEDEARKKEKERLEKEQKEKERLEKEQKEKERYRNFDLFHICHIQNLPSIIAEGLFSYELVPSGFKDIANQEIRDRRGKYNKKLGLRLTEFASTYFEPINAMYFIETLKHYGKPEIVIVEFRLDLSKPGTEITDGNAATWNTVKTNFIHHSFVRIMSEIQKETIETQYKGKDQWADGKDDPDYKEHVRKKQAECLVPSKISRDCITSIHVYNDPESISAANRLIDDSGLRINLKTIDKYPKSIKGHEH